MQRPGLLGEHPELFCLLSRRFRQRAVLFGTVTLLIRLLPKIFSLFPPLLGLDAVRLTRSVVVRHMSLLAKVESAAMIGRMHRSHN